MRTIVRAAIDVGSKLAAKAIPKPQAPAPRPAVRMRVALTGVPGSGKTTIAQALEAKGARVVHLNDFARDAGLLTEMDAARGSFVVDVDALADKLNDALGEAEERLVVIEGHFAHEMDADAIVLLRCDPLVL